ncbi:MAG: GNAT family protein [Syntrophomonadaceae bacterium]|nr:GNAT family protein [Syntrophomonadaceae bacterium]
MTAAKKIPGRRIYLSPIDINDSEIYVRWLNDIVTYIYLDLAPLVINNVFKKGYLENALKKGAQEFGIRLAADNKLIGNCGLININNINRKAELGIFIAEKDYLNQGYGSEAISLLLAYGFNILNLNSIYLRCYSYNMRAARCYEKCGFKPAGRYRQAKIINGVRYDDLLMDILAEEFSPAL